MSIVLSIILLISLMLLGIPIGVALGVAGGIGLLLSGGYEALYTVLSTVPYRSAASVSLSTVPLFILMAQFINQGGIAKNLFTAAHKFVGRAEGGVAMATVLASAAFGAVSGSSTAAAATMAPVVIPECRRLGYNISVASGVVSVAGTLAIMIPPSIVLVIYGLTTETSIGKLLIAGVIPGILTAGIYIIGIALWARLVPSAMPRGVQSYTWIEKLASLRDIWPFGLIFVFIVVALYGGFATPTETAAIGAAASLGVLAVSRRITWIKVREALRETIVTTSMIFTIIIGAMIFGYFLTSSHATQDLLELISQAQLPAGVVLGIVCLVYIVLGCFLDQIATLLLTLPLTFPIITGLGYDPIWFGVIVTALAEIGLVTPPVGMNAYVVAGAADIPIEEVFRGTGVMLLFEAVTLVLLLMFPQIVTWLPGLAS